MNCQIDFLQLGMYLQLVKQLNDDIQQSGAIIDQYKKEIFKPLKKKYLNHLLPIFTSEYYL